MTPIKIGRVMWPGPIGIGAGLVKNGAMMLNFAERASAVEIGSITRYNCVGNTGRTVFKLAEHQSLWHNAGLPNHGIEQVVEELLSAQDQMTIPWGINVAVTPGIIDSIEAAIDIRETTKILLASGLDPDWLTLNVASPDTGDSVNMLSAPARVSELIGGIQAAVSGHESVPLWLKLGPGMSNDRLEELVKVSIEQGVEALVCGNTLPDKSGGGWGGKIIRAQADATLGWLSQIVGDKLALIGVGGVMTGADAQHKLDLGATAVQVVSALLIKGREAAKIIESELVG